MPVCLRTVALTALGVTAGVAVGVALAPASVVGSTLVTAAVPATYLFGIPWSFLQLSAATAAVYAPVYAATTATLTACGVVGAALGGAAGTTVSFLFNSRPCHAPGPTEEDRSREQQAMQAVEHARDMERRALAAEQAVDIVTQAREEAERNLEVAQERIRSAEEDQRQYPIPPYLRSACESGQVNIAITGHSGVGKSSFINTLRRMRKNDPGYARVGVNETTMEPTMFAFPKSIGIMRRISAHVLERFQRGESPDPTEGGVQVGDRITAQLPDDPEHDGRPSEVIRLEGNAVEVRYEDGVTKTVPRSAVRGIFADAKIWDLPGAGTPRFPQGTYVKDMGLRYFDMVVLITAERFTEAERLLKDELDHWNVPYFLVRSKADVSVTSMIDEEADCQEEELSAEQKQEIKRKTVEDIKAHFAEAYGMDLVYVLSTQPKFRDDYDFQQLERDMVFALMTVRGVSMERECPMCLETYADLAGGSTAGTRQRVGPCGHTCCETCLGGLRARGSVCPTCRSPLEGA